MASARQNGVECPHYYPASGVTASPYYKTHRDLLSQPRGCGLWAWKPIIIDHLFNEGIVLGADNLPLCKNGDICIYSDAGIEFINSVSHIIDRMDQDIFLFGNQWEHAHWCKADIVGEIWPNCLHGGRGCRCPNGSDLWGRFGKQVQASVIVFRVSEYTRKFVKEWLDYCLMKNRFASDGSYLIDDAPSAWFHNHPEFRENRHDQAILTTMAYREGVNLHWWPARYNDGAFVYERGGYPDEGYPVTFNHHRRRNHEWSNAA